MDFLPILATLRRHRTAASLIVLQVAVTCAIVSNAIFLIDARVSHMTSPSGIAEDELVHVKIAGVSQHNDAKATTAEDLRSLAQIPGVRAAANTDMLPFGGNSWNTDISLIPNDPDPPINAAMYLGSADLLETLGVTLVAGRDFSPDEYADFKDVVANKAPLPSVIITRAVANRLFADGDAIGKPVYVWGDAPQLVIGIVDRLARPEANGPPDSEGMSMILPVTVSYADGANEYVLRVDPARRAEVLAAAVAAIQRVDPDRIILDQGTFATVRREHFKGDRSMAWLLLGVCIALLVITALGIVGLASFWVQQRRRQIGIRRALGASRGRILLYFQTENFVLATFGIVLGMILAFGLNQLLVDKYHVGRLPAVFLPIGATLLWALGQIAVLGPALRAAAVPPAVATRSV
jgi:putative ABC transport system permease protein